jgi:hypothetical protein
MYYKIKSHPNVLFYLLNQQTTRVIVLKKPTSFLCILNSFTSSVSVFTRNEFGQRPMELNISYQTTEFKAIILKLHIKINTV